MIPKERFRSVYAPGTRQNRAGSAGLYRFYLAHTWSTDLLPNGRYRIEVEASDLSGNVGMLVGSDLIHQPSPRTGRGRYRVRPVLPGRA